jgi:hypothetical protein
MPPKAIAGCDSLDRLSVEPLRTSLPLLGPTALAKDISIGVTQQLYAKISLPLRLQIFEVSFLGRTRISEMIAIVTRHFS